VVAMFRIDYVCSGVSMEYLMLCSYSCVASDRKAAKASFRPSALLRSLAFLQFDDKTVRVRPRRCATVASHTTIWASTLSRIHATKPNAMFCPPCDPARVVWCGHVHIDNTEYTPCARVGSAVAHRPSSSHMHPVQHPGRGGDRTQGILRRGTQARTSSRGKRVSHTLFT
jgi:hypothetical protein